MHNPSYGLLRRAVFQMFVAESVYRAYGNISKADECRQLAVRIMASMSQTDFDTLVAEIANNRRHGRILGHRVT